MIDAARLKELTKNLEKAIELTTNIPEKIRPRMVGGRPGGLLDFSGVDKDFYVVADLHSNIKNFKAILETDNLKQRLIDDEAIFVILGDAVHEDRTGYLTEMGPGTELMELIIELIIELPDNIFFTRGNHETFDEQLSKNGIRQGKVFSDYVETHRSAEYRDLLQDFFDSVPLFVIADKFLGVHAGPIRGGCTREHLIEVFRYDSDVMQLTWNRINQIRSMPNNREYTDFDIDKTRELIGKDDSCYFIVGHNPLLDRGGGDSIWFNVEGTTNYIIIYNALPEVCPILKFTPDSDEYILLYADLKIKKPKFVLGDYY